MKAIVLGSAISAVVHEFTNLTVGILKTRLRY
jgi:hypothetical protein